jgi:hypothetical protein
MGGQTLIIWSLVVMAEGASGGQDSPLRLDHPLQFGETLYLETANGGRVRGRLEDFDGDRIRVDGLSFSLSQGEVRRIEAEVDDSVGNGGLIGAGIGAGAALLLCAAAGGDCEEFLLFLGPVYAGAGAGFGVLVDALHHGRRLVYVAPPSGFERKLTVSPIWTRDRMGVAVSFRF